MYTGLTSLLIRLTNHPGESKIIGVQITAVNFTALQPVGTQAERAALSNDANMIAMGQQVTGNMVARLMVQTYMKHTGTFDTTGRSAPKVQRIYDYAAEHQN